MAGAVIAAAADPHSPEWHALRRSGIGGSDAAAALGVSPYLTQYELYLAKLGELPPLEMTGPLEWGQRLERSILQAYEDHTGMRVTTPKETLRSAEHPFMLANLDGIAERGMSERRLVDAKNVRSSEGWGDAGSDDVPLVYYFQAQHYMVVTALPVTDFAVLMGGQDFRIYTVRADAEVQAQLIEGEAQFWSHVKMREPPPAVTLEDARRRWGRSDARGTLVASQEQLQLVRDTAAMIKRLEALQAEIDANKVQIMEALGDEYSVLVDGTSRELLTWKRAAGAKRVDAELLKAAHPEVYTACLKAGEPTRRMLFKEGALAWSMQQ